MSMTKRSLESENAMLAEDHEYAEWLADRDQESRQQQDYEAVALAGMTSILTRHRRTMEIGKELGRYEEIERQSLTASRIEQGTIEMAGRNAALQLALRKVEAELGLSRAAHVKLAADLAEAKRTIAALREEQGYCDDHCDHEICNANRTAEGEDTYCQLRVGRYASDSLCGFCQERLADELAERADAARDDE